MADCDQVRRLSIQLFGQFSVRVNGVEIQIKQWKSKKALNLFRFLALKKGQKISKDVLIDLFWPDGEDGDDATHKLHSTMYLLRKTLQLADSQADTAALIHYSDGMYWLDESGDIWVDTVEFETLYRSANELKDKDRFKAAAAYGRALSLYKGDLLPETQYQDWSSGAREYYHDMFLDASVRMAELLAESSDYNGAIKCCKDALRIDKYCENLHNLTLCCLIESSRYHEASRHYRDFTEALYQDLGLAPSQETKKLYDELKKHISYQNNNNDSSTIAEPYTGPFICDRHTFNAILSLEVRKQKRIKEPIVHGVIHLEAPKENRANIIKTICNTLRQSDVICTDFDDQLLLQLHGTSEPGVRVVKARLERALSLCGTSYQKIDIKIKIIS